jgi:hypothetical protein
VTIHGANFGTNKSDISATLTLKGGQHPNP